MEQFRRSSYSDNNGKECVEVANTLRAVRDSKNPAGPVLRVDLTAFLAQLRSGQFVIKSSPML
jgi:hypothetical protein